MSDPPAQGSHHSQTCVNCGHSWRDHPGYSGESACIECVQQEAAEACRRMVSEPLAGR